MSVKPTLPAKMAPKNDGPIGMRAKFDNPDQAMPMGVPGLNGLYNDIGEMSGFQGDTSSYIDKKGTPYGEAAKFNFLPPGMDISNQENCDIRNMTLKKLVDVSYPGDGWNPAPKDLNEI